MLSCKQFIHGDQSQLETVGLVRKIVGWQFGKHKIDFPLGSPG